MSRMSRNIIVAVIIIIVLILIMVYSSSKNPFVRQLRGPTEGTDSVVTADGRLSIVSKSNHIYTWQWNDLSIWPVVARPASQAVSLIADDRIIYVASGEIGKLIIANLKTDKELASLSLPYDAECRKIKTSQNGKFGVLSTLFKEGVQKGWLKLAVFDSELKGLSFAFQKNTAENFLVYDFDITDDGGFLAGAGEKGRAWIFVTDVNNGNILWEKIFDEYDRFTSVEFSPDCRTLFVAERVRHILAFDTATGQLLNKFVMDEYQTPVHLKQNVSCIAISPDGKVLAADTEPAGVVWFWDITSGKEIGRLSVGSSRVVSGIAFSPDSKYLAIGYMVRPEITIWKVPTATNVSK